MVDWKGCGRNRSWSSWRYYPNICFDGLRKTTKKSLRLAGLLSEILIRDVLNKKLEC
jgi:hypothetical protein